MKLKNFKNVCLIVILLIFAACSNDEKPTDNNNNTNIKKMTAFINGSEWKADSVTFVAELGPARKQLRIFGTKGLDSIELILKFTPLDTILPGTYTLAQNSDFLAVYRRLDSRDTASEGTLILSKIKEEYPEIAVGTYNFVIKKNQNTLYTITEGIFDSGNSK